MTELRSISANPDQAKTHVIFVHGLSGDIRKTWAYQSSNSEVFWPPWLEEDISGVATWLVGYPGAKSNWGGYGISITDRAKSISARILAEPVLTSGTIVFVAHSLGGLVVKQILRTMQDSAYSDERSEKFLSRMKGVAFLGTPHRGSYLADIANKVSLFFRPSDVTRDLRWGNPQLRDLNNWYRIYSRDKGIRNLLLVESVPLRVLGLPVPKILGTIVSQESADCGLQEIPISVDENHTQICKPDTKNSEVYVHVKDFVDSVSSLPLQFENTNEKLEKIEKLLQEQSNHLEYDSAAITEIRKLFEKDIATLGTNPEIIDKEVESRLDRLRKCRYFPEFDEVDFAKNLAASLNQDGDLALASLPKKGTALAWCARILASEAPIEAKEILNRIRSSGDDIHDVARTLVKTSHSDVEEVVGELCEIGTPMAFGSAFISILRAKGVHKATEWLRNAGLSFVSLDCDAKCGYIYESLKNGDWDVAYAAAKEVEEAEFKQSPGLHPAVAEAFLIYAVPDEFRLTGLNLHLPFYASQLPLRSDPIALENRRHAIDHFEKLHSFAISHDLSGLAAYADDKALWLRIMDPETKAEALDELKQSLMSPETPLRRIGLASQFGIDINHERINREINRQTALSGGMSPDAASARFALALSMESPGTAAEYMQLHRDQLLQHIDWENVYLVEISMLARSGQLAKAEERLNEAIDKGLSESDITRIRHELTEAGGGDPIAERLAAYNENKSILDLRSLVAAYGEAKDWPNACIYGRKLLHRTGTLEDARILVFALYHLEMHDELLSVLEEFPSLRLNDETIRVLRVRTLFENGMLNESLDASQELTSDSSESRQLQLDLAIFSGDWESLQGFVEDEWNARSERKAPDLLRAGQIAEQIGAVRGRELVREAASHAEDDPAVLIGCYATASSAGWDDSIEVHGWMERAAELSGEDGPVQKISIEEILKKKPDWERRESKVWDLLQKGDAPQIIASLSLNLSLLNLNLMPALINLNEPDVRKRSLVYAFSGARGRSKAQPRTVAMDATALITAEYLGLLDVYIEQFDSIVIPHSTLGWLFEEKSRILFHQPSRVTAARELREMIANRKLLAFECSTVVSEKLVDEIGYSLAELISEASSPEHKDTRQRLVVRGRPVHKVNLLMQEEADLSVYETYLCSDFAVVDYLRRKGILTSSEKKEAITMLEGREFQWQSEPKITDEAILYLDDLAVSQLQFLGLLSKLQECGLTVYVATNKIEEADALISYDSVSHDVVEIVDTLRIRLREGLRIGKLRLGKAFRSDDGSSPDSVSPHPAIDMLRLNEAVDAGVVDDRFISQHGTVSLGPNDRPLLTTPDILDMLTERGAISAERRCEALTNLRKAQFALIPLVAEDMNELIVDCSVVNGKLQETAEIKSIRENIERIRMSNMLQIPKELEWLDGITQIFNACLQEQWNNDFDEVTTMARSDWFLAVSDVRKWAHRIHDNVEQYNEQYLNWIVLLMFLQTHQEQSVKEAYWRWLDLRVLEPLQNNEPDCYKNLLERAKERVAGILAFCEQKLGKGDEIERIKPVFVRFALNYLPPRVRNSLISDRKFLESWKLETFAYLTIDGNGPTFQQDQLYKCIRESIRTPATKIKIEDVQNISWWLEMNSEDESLSISLENGQNKFTISDYLGLAEDRSARINWFTKVAEEADLTGEAHDEWKSKIDSRSLSNEDYPELIADLSLTPTNNYFNLRSEILRGQVKVKTLIPGERRYYDRLVGTCRPAMDVNGYIRSEVKPLIEQFQDRDPERGFLASLLLCSKSAVSELIQIDKLSVEQLLHSYEWITNYGDPISQVGALEVALRHTDLVPKIEPFIEKIAESFIGDEANDNEGWFSLLSTMIILVSSELGRMGIMKEVRPFYRRQAAIAQASIITRAIKTTNADSADIVEWVRRETGSVPEFYLQGGVDLRYEPRWLPNFVDAGWLRAEIIGRVSNAVKQYEGKIQSESLCELLIGEDSKLSSVVVSPFSKPPGPLEGELSINEGGIPDQFIGNAIAELEDDQLKPSSFYGVFDAALFYEMPSSHAELVSKALERVKYSIENVDDEDSFHVLTLGLAYLAAVTRSTDLAKSLRVLVRVYKRKNRLRLALDDELSIIMTAAVSHEEIDDWAHFIGEWITELAFEVTEKSTARLFLKRLRRLVNIESSLARHCAIADASLESVAR